MYIRTNVYNINLSAIKESERTFLKPPHAHYLTLKKYHNKNTKTAHLRRNETGSALKI